MQKKHMKITNCIFSLHNIFYYSLFTTCFNPMWSSSGISYSYNHLDIGFYSPYTGQCLHVGKVLTYMVRRWVRHIKEGSENVDDDPQNGRPSVVNEDLVHTVEEKIQENRQFTTSSLSLHFPQISWSLLHKLCLINFVFGNYVHAECPGCRRWLRMNTHRR
jgi:hypothetical protein